MGSLITLRAEPGALKGEISIELPGSKSIHNRLLIIQKLSEGKVKILGKSESDDSRFLNRALNHTAPEMWMGEGGTALRFGLAWAAVTPGERVIDGSDRLKERPIMQLVEALRSLGADIRSATRNHRMPFAVKGKKLKGGRIRLTDNISSQFISALLMIGPYTENGIRIEIHANQVSRPYIAMTTALMLKAGARIEQSNSEIFVHPEPYKKSEISVERDWSSASYFFEWVLFNDQLRIKLPGLSLKSIQGDAKIAGQFMDLGVATAERNGTLTLSAAESKNISRLNFLEIPDMAQSFAVAAAGLKRPFVLDGLQTLKVKETDRIEALKKEMFKLGVQSKASDISLEILSFAKPQSEVTIDTYRDHRMAMAFAPFVSILGNIKIRDPEVVTKSFPGYWNEIQKLGVEVIKT